MPGNTVVAAPVLVTDASGNASAPGGFTSGGTVTGTNFQNSAGACFLGALGGTDYPIKILTNGVHQMFGNREIFIGSNIVGVGNANMERTVRIFNPVTLTGTSTTANLDLGNNNMQLIGITGRVTTAATGSGLTGLNIGDTGSTPIGGSASATKFASNLGIAQNTTFNTGNAAVNFPITYSGSFTLAVTPVGATTFTAGALRIVAYFVTIATT